jgi:hypothetical protein
MTSEVLALCSRRAELLRELADLELELARALDARDRRPEPDSVLALHEAAALMGEPVSTFRRRLEYRKALISRPTERRLRYSRAMLEAIRKDRLALALAEAQSLDSRKPKRLG